MSTGRRNFSDIPRGAESLDSRLEEIDKLIGLWMAPDRKTNTSSGDHYKTEAVRRANAEILRKALTDDRIIEAFQRSRAPVAAPICIRPLCLDYRLYLAGSDLRIVRHLRENYEDFDDRVRSLESKRIRLFFDSIRDKRFSRTFTLPSGIQKELYRVLGHRFILQRLMAPAAEDAIPA